MKLLGRIYKILVFAILFMIIWGWIVYHSLSGGTRFGETVRDTTIEIAKFPETVKSLFGEMRYVSNMQFKPKTAVNNIYNLKDITDSSNNVSSGYMLYSAWDTISSKPMIYFADLGQKRIVETWEVPYQEIFDQLQNENDSIISQYSTVYGNVDFGRIRVKSLTYFNLENTLLYRLNDDGPMVSFDTKTKQINWVAKDVFHHSIEMDHEDHIWAPAYKYNTRFTNEYEMVDDYIIQLDKKTGEVLFEKSVLQIMIDNGLLVEEFGDKNEKDPVHLNDIEPALEDTEYWKKGDLFLSLRNSSMLVLYRPTNNTVLWYQKGPWINQHDVDIINNTTISVFGNDNLRGEWNNPSAQFPYKTSNIYTYDFGADEVKEPYKEVLNKIDYKLFQEGKIEIQEDSTVFIEETLKGRYMLLNSDSVLWSVGHLINNEYVNMGQWGRYLRYNQEGELIE